MTIRPTSHRFMSQRLQLHYVDWGNPDAPPLLLVHGSLDHCRSWDWTAQALADQWHVIAVDLRGHGDSAWSPEGNYSMMSHAYDLAQLVHQLQLAPVNIVAHSLGGGVALRYAGLYPQNVARLVVIEGLGPSPQLQAEISAKPLAQRLCQWIDDKRAAAGRQPKRYATLEEAYTRMKSENSYLSDTQARHLTTHGISQNEDGSYSWKFDNYMRLPEPVRLSQADLESLWQAITCPTLLLYGANSWASNPAEDGRARHFRDARVELYENAGHWLHHDRTDKFIRDVKDFLDQ
ncbi:alpha/beta hydrolase [Pseudomaricurvus alcaniphilus]|uniref:alpha/beta fold hydrolase n=1 Tax=Pseudomaricurvus alcaniphilus TaxID=1166482 RepID=UPI00140B10D1|nr:alpha/beta hydrolase [Pseudomaricurvus alcaniphilus]NHN36971.1 alpha/beta hydrolase [Pseudomaricurvus alcaniphilus]